MTINAIKSSKSSNQKKDFITRNKWLLVGYLLKKLHQIIPKWNNFTNMSNEDRNQIQNLNLKKQ